MPKRKGYKNRTYVDCPECGKSVGNLFLHQRIHKKKSQSTEQKAKPPLWKLSEFSIEEMFKRRRELEDQMASLNHEIHSRLEELGLQVAEASGGIQGNRVA